MFLINWLGAKSRIDEGKRGGLESPSMAQLVEEIKGLYELYPSWLVSACLGIVGLGVLWALWKLVRLGMVVAVAVLLLGIVAFVGWTILAS